ncbi:MAG: hypothetical protein KatS3mg057_1592 [Herpetosiphonaceae bacterium]|nr:MAG: hypothetical protein KatS3mg057_1592 [Herpetosiphonaceae bacterium]
MLRDHSHISTPKDEVLPSLALLKHMQEYLPIHKALVRGGAGDLLYKKMHDYWSRTIEAYFSAHMTQKHKMAVPLPILANYIAGSCTNLIKWWLEHNIPCSPEEMLHIFQLLVWPGVEAALVSEE